MCQMGGDKYFAVANYDIEDFSPFINENSPVTVTYRVLKQGGIRNQLNAVHCENQNHKTGTKKNNVNNITGRKSTPISSLMVFKWIWLSISNCWEFICQMIYLGTNMLVILLRK
ncbi:Hypothetical predicted protein, partial [Paramuricea clavata]